MLIAVIKRPDKAPVPYSWLAGFGLFNLGFVSVYVMSGTSNHFLGLFVPLGLWVGGGRDNEALLR
jgi:hypothetical protein